MLNLTIALGKVSVFLIQIFEFFVSKDFSLQFLYYDFEKCSEGIVFVHL